MQFSLCVICYCIFCVLALAFLSLHLSNKSWTLDVANGNFLVFRTSPYATSLDEMIVKVTQKNALVWIDLKPENFLGLKVRQSKSWSRSIFLSFSF